MEYAVTSTDHQWGSFTASYRKKKHEIWNPDKQAFEPFDPSNIENAMNQIRHAIVAGGGEHFIFPDVDPDSKHSTIIWFDVALDDVMTNNSMHRWGEALSHELGGIMEQLKNPEVYYYFGEIMPDKKAGHQFKENPHHVGSEKAEDKYNSK